MPIKRDIRRLVRTEKSIISLIRRDESIVEQKLNEKDISKLLKLIGQQELVDEKEIREIEQELKEEERLIDDERQREEAERKKTLKKVEDKELIDEIHHLRIIYVLIPLIRQKNESLKKQKELLEEKKTEFTLADLPMLIRKEQDVLKRIEVYEEEAEALLRKIEDEEAEEIALMAGQLTEKTA